MIVPHLRCQIDSCQVLYLAALYIVQNLYLGHFPDWENATLPQFTLRPDGASKPAAPV